MSQATLDEDELFGEAASEMRTDVEEALDELTEMLPDEEQVWDVESDNTLGVLNSLKDASSVEDAHEQLRTAKKWYTMGDRADAFEDGSDLLEEIETIEETLGHLETVNEHVTELTSEVPQLRTALSDLADEDDE